MSAVESIAATAAAPVKKLISLKNREAILNRYRAQHISKAQSLPPKLQRFFAAHPPPQILPFLGRSSAPNRDHIRTLVDPYGKLTLKEPSAILAQDEPHNPFKPFKNPETGRWRPSKYSLRQQADIAKLAEQHNVEALLPFTPKLASERLRKRVEGGIRMKGTGVGQQVKGHQWERQLKTKLDKRRKAMLAMPQMIQDWRQRGKGKGWKKWPSRSGKV